MSDVWYYKTSFWRWYDGDEQCQGRWRSINGFSDAAVRGLEVKRPS